MRARLTWLVAILAAIGSGLAWQSLHAQAPSAPAASGQASGNTQAPPPVPNGTPVVIGTAETRDVPVYLFGLGTVQAFNTVTVKARVDGQIDKIGFIEGQDVKAGDLLAQIDPRPLAATLAQMQAQKAKDEAQLANARLDLERFSNLMQRDFASRQSVDTQRATVAQLTAAIQGDDAQIQAAKVQLGYTSVVAPISGRTGVRLVDQGNIVHASDTGGIVVITQVKPISVMFTLPQDALDQVTGAMAKGQLKVLAFKRDGTTKLGEGTVALIDNQIDPAAGTIRLKATFPNDDLRLWPGGFVNAELELGVLHDTVAVAASVVQRGPHGPFAYVVKADQTVEARPVELGPARGEVAVITAGITAGERVVVDGQTKLRPGMRVTPVSSGEGGARPGSAS